MQNIEINGIKYIPQDKINEKFDFDSFLNKYCIIRTYSAGVFAGTIICRNGKEAIIKDARRIWSWKGAASLSQLAMEGVKYPNECKFPCPINELLLTEIIEIIPCSQKAIDSINSVPIWEAQ